MPPTALGLSDDTEDLVESHISDADAQSIIELSIGRAATRLKAASTPAAEKAAAMEELEGGGLFDSDPETSPVLDATVETPVDVLPSHSQSSRTLGPFSPTEVKRNKEMSLEALQPPHLGQRPSFPINPWHSGVRTLVTSPSTSQSPLQGIFDAGRRRASSLSAGADALRRLFPKSLPSISQVGNLFGSSSSNSAAKSRSGSGSSSFAKDAGHPGSTEPAYESRPPLSPMNGVNNHMHRSSHSQTFPILDNTRLPISSSTDSPASTPRPQVIRRVTSDDSLLYHSLSRASSLGDDSRFEKQHDQVNSRVKAIRDSLQDRANFRMPQMPSIPSMPNMPSMPRVPSFSFNTMFMNSGHASMRWRPDTDRMPDISDILPLPTGSRKKPSATPEPIFASGITGPTVIGPDGDTKPARAPSPDSQNHLERAMESLEGDIVIMGGYRGSILRSAKPPHRQVWVPVKVGLNIRKVDLEVGLDPEDEEHMEETIFPSGMLKNIGPVDISKRLFKRLSECESARNGKLRVWDYGYDWRLSPHLLSRKLTTFLENLPSNKLSKDGPVGGQKGALVIAHSLGGLITRHVVNQRPELFSGVIYAGVPQSCVNILGPIRNGDAVLLSSRVLTAQVNFTLRTSFVLLPEDGSCFIDINTKERYPVDFFGLDDWIKYRFSPCTDPPLPPFSQSSGGLGSILNKSGSLLSLPIPSKKSVSSPSSPAFSTGQFDNEYREPPQSPELKANRAVDTLRNAKGGTDRTLAPQMGGNVNPMSKGHNTNSSTSTAVTIPRDKAISYLRRTLAETKKFKQELYFKPELSSSNRYPPLALIYGKSIPTCCGAKVNGRESIPCADVYDNLAFASGDGVCLAKEAMLPEGYKAVYGGRISSERGHVSLLGDLKAVGRAIEAVLKGRGKGIGLGVEDGKGKGLGIR
ncbi:hypothetical protein B7494_g7869 [Chlorociboria aeruginascens]|nr:hypothetical protein B7494_g7869 [Chlorociboria aeruginascens]